MSAAREGGCSCGEVRYRLASEPLFVRAGTLDDPASVAPDTEKLWPAESLERLRAATAP